MTDCLLIDTCQTFLVSHAICCSIIPQHAPRHNGHNQASFYLFLLIITVQSSLQGTEFMCYMTIVATIVDQKVQCHKKQHCRPRLVNYNESTRNRVLVGLMGNTRRSYLLKRQRTKAIFVNVRSRTWVSASWRYITTPPISRGSIHVVHHIQFLY